MQLDHKLCSEIQYQLASFSRKILKRKVSGAWQAITELWIELRESALLLVKNVLIDLPNQRSWHHMKMSKRLCRRLAKLPLTSFLLEHFKGTSLAPGNPPPNLIIFHYIQNLCRFSECCSKTTLKNELLEGSLWNGHLSYACIMSQVHLPYRGKIDLSRVNQCQPFSNCSY